MMVPTGQLLGELEQALERAAFEDTPILLGELERLRARLWFRMMTPASTPPNDQRRGRERDVAHGGPGGRDSAGRP